MKLVNETWKEGTAYECLLVADTTPAALPTSGAQVDGMNAAHTFAPMSVLFVVDPAAEHKVYIANEAGQFVAQ